MPFKTEDKKVSDLLNKRVYLIPRNQRQYVWKEENWKDLIEDLEFSFISSKRAHFMGSIVLKKEKGRDKGAGVEVFSIIDGQQRITTFLLFLSVIMFRFKKDNETERFEGLKSYLITNNLDNNAFCKLSTEKYPALENLFRTYVIGRIIMILWIRQSVSHQPQQKPTRFYLKQLSFLMND